MLKCGLMRIGGAEYTLYELWLKNFRRFDIVKKDREFHIDTASVLFSRYRQKRWRLYGDISIYQQYFDTVTALKKMPCGIISETRWENGRYIYTEQKGEKGNRFVMQTHNGVWYGELYERDGVMITMRMLDANFKSELLPMNDNQFKTQERKFTCRTS